jgi:hypothetical protein
MSAMDLWVRFAVGLGIPRRNLNYEPLPGFASLGCMVNKATGRSPSVPVWSLKAADRNE